MCPQDALSLSRVSRQEVQHNVLGDLWVDLWELRGEVGVHVLVCTRVFTHDESKQVTAASPSSIDSSPFYPPDQLYFAILKQKIRSTADRHCFCVDDELAYEK